MGSTIQPVLLAAGASSRMGEHKLLLPILGEPMVHRVARTILEAGFAELLVVLGRDSDLVQAALKDLPCNFVQNQNFLNGKMQSSFKVALENILSDAALFALADMPLVPSTVYAQLQKVFLETNANIVASKFGGIVAPPHVFSKKMFAELINIGARPCIQKNFTTTHWQDWPAEWLRDIDTPEDYAALTKNLKPET